jgi:stage II sporulation protein D
VNGSRVVAAPRIAHVSRSRFLGLAAVACALPASLGLPLRARAQDEYDPATNSRRPELRVLLGAGDAQPAAGGFLFRGRPYRGTFERLPSGEIVNVVDLEQYLYAVVPHEMPPSWPQPALQAQAVCARTYVLQRSDPRRGYDLVPSEADQVYPGMSGETPAGRMAVDATAGQVIKFGNAYAQIAYSSCCGGHTESAAEAWTGGAVLPYLAGVVCTYCSESPYYRWQTTLGLDDVSRACGDRLQSIGALQSVRVSSVDPSGRARAFDLSGPTGVVTIKGSTFRLLVGARVLRSLLVMSVRQQPNPPSLWFDGGGLGHGVGLCQWGARGLAQQGRSATDIVGWYFPGTTVAAA